MEAPKEETKIDSEKQKAKVMDVGELLAEEINSSAFKNKPRVTDISTFEEI